MTKNTQKTLTQTGLLLGALTLTACSGYSETFECEPGKGVGCTSLSSVNRLVETGALPVLDDSEKKEEEKIKSKEKREEGLPQLMSVHSRGEPVQTKRLRVWMASYEDSAGYYHEATHVLGKPRHD